MKSFIPIALAVLGFSAQGYALSCKKQEGTCHSGDRECPAGTKSVLWDSGCKEATWPWENDDKCCVKT